MSASSGYSDLQARANAEGWWPVDPKLRTWGSISVLGVTVSACVATWLFIIGSTVAFFLGAVQGTVAMLSGALVGILLAALAVLPVTARYGIDSIAALRPQMGTKGAYLGLGLLGLSVIGWNAVLVIFTGRAFAGILVALNVMGEQHTDLVVSITAVVTTVIVWLALRSGAGAVQKVGVGIAVLVVLLGIFILVMVVKQAGVSTLLEAEPLAPSESSFYNWTTAFEMVVATNLAWVPFIGGLVRLGSGPRKALWPIIIGIGLPVGLLSVIGLLAALAVPESGGDPTIFMMELGGVAGGVPALAFIVLANFGTVLICSYIAAIGVGQVQSLQGRLSWSLTTLAVLLPIGVLAAFFSHPFYDNISMFLSCLGAAFAPVVGVMIADNYLLRRQISLRGLFVHGAGTPYHYWKGFNPAGLIAAVVGAGCYVYLLNPITLVSNSPYEYMSASLPSALVAGLTYTALMKWVMPKAWLTPSELDA